MPYHLRYQESEWSVHHVVSRFTNGFCMLKPTPQVNRICAGVLGRSTHLYADRINLIFYVMPSNHVHLLIESRDARSLSAFMQHFKSNLARELARVHDWEGPMWQSRYSSEETLDKESFEERLKYCMENTVKEGLVSHPRAWRGLHGFHQLIDRTPLIGAWIDRTALYKARLNPNTRDQVELKDFTRYYKVELKKPRIYANMSDREYHEHCVKLTKEAIASARAKFSGHPIGMTRVLAEPVFKVRKKKRGRRSLCRAHSPKLMEAYHERYLAFKRAYQAAYRYAREQILKGVIQIEMRFPPGGITPMSMIKLSRPPQLE